MTRSIRTSLILVACVAAGAAWSGTAETQGPPADSKPAVKVALLLAPATQTIKGSQQPRFTATLVNRGQQPVVLVEPGDGSESGWRTPLIHWSPRQPGRVVRCGNINALRPKEVFTLKPGASHLLSDWLGQPHVAETGRHRVSLRYTNEPARKWQGLPLGKHNPNAMVEVGRSTPVAIVSNTVEVVVEP